MEIQKMRLVAVQKLFGPDKVGLWRTLERKHTIKCEAASQVVCERELPRLFTWEVYHLMGFFISLPATAAFVVLVEGLSFCCSSEVSISKAGMSAELPCWSIGL